ncbi:MAG: phosphatase PAP2 family protein [Jatrophihabitans sp.]
MPVNVDDRPTLRERGFAGILPARMTRYRRPRWWQEIGLIAIGYWLYGLVRNAVPEHETLALRHGRSVQHLQDRLHLNFERSLNHWVGVHEPIAQVMDYYYATLHFIVTIGVLVWLFVAHPRIYRGARTVLFGTTIVALVGFYLYPLAPPRLLPQYGYIDTLIKFHTWGSLADPKLAERSNQYAAMPSLHIGWALWGGLSIFFCSRILWLRIAALLYPVGTLLVIVGTANHFILDAVGGVVTLLVGFGIQRLLSGHGGYRPAELPEPDQPGPAPS